MEASFQPGEVIGGRYELVCILGEGALGRTMLANDLKLTDKQVALKELLPSRMKRWKDYDLFHRECHTLRALDHPAIPTYYEEFEIESQNDEPNRLFLVQQFVNGRSLQDALDAGAEFTEHRVREIMIAVLGVLDYLHTLNPPVIHRDLKPANIMETEDGEIVVIDFGAVREAITSEGVGSTIVGTLGYMPPEQYAGSATPATDLFALGATAVQLVSGRQPSELFEGIHQFHLPSSLPVTLGFERVLLKLTEADVDKRYQSAKAVTRDLAARFLMVPKESIVHELPIPFEIRPAPRPFPGFQFRDPNHGRSHSAVVIVSFLALLLTLALPVTAFVGGEFALMPFAFFPAIAAIFLGGVSKRSWDEIQVYRRGAYTLGEITGRFIGTNTVGTVNLTYRYWAKDRFRYGAMSTTDRMYRELTTGDPLGVIFLPDETSRHVLYAVAGQFAQKQASDRPQLEFEPILRINLNTATKEELEKLPGIGEKIAERIIEHREEEPFTASQASEGDRLDARLVDLIGDKRFEKIRKHIVI